MSEVGRNAPCPCGSGRKYKRCCIESAPAAALEPTPAEAADLLIRLLDRIQGLSAHETNKVALHQLFDEDSGIDDLSEQGLRLLMEVLAQELGYPYLVAFDLPGDSGLTIAETALQRESTWFDAVERNWLRSLGQSHVSLYEIVGKQPPHAVRAIEVFHGGEVVIDLTHWRSAKPTVGQSVLGRLRARADGTRGFEGAAFALSVSEHDDLVARVQPRAKTLFSADLRGKKAFGIQLLSAWFHITNLLVNAEDVAQKMLKSKSPRSRAPAGRPATPKTAAPGGTTERIARLEVTLRESDPPIWRLIEVPADITLDRLHDVLQCTMGWTNSHLHLFDFCKSLYTPASDTAELGSSDERKARLDSLLNERGARLTYAYDFGDGWEHDVILKDFVAKELGATYPRATDGARACPPEDVGGVFRYAEFLEALADPKHSEHAEYRDWIGEFDPEEFDLAAINTKLVPLAKKRAKRGKTDRSAEG